MATHSTIFAWRIPWTEETGGPQSMGSQSWTRLSNLAHTHTHTDLFHLDFSKMLMPLSLFPHRCISGKYRKATVMQPFLFLPALGGSFPNGPLTSGLSSLKAILHSRSRVVFTMQIQSAQSMAFGPG